MRLALSQYQTRQKQEKKLQNNIPNNNRYENSKEFF